MALFLGLGSKFRAGDWTQEGSGPFGTKAGFLGQNEGGRTGKPRKAQCDGNKRERESSAERVAAVRGRQARRTAAERRAMEKVRTRSLGVE